MCVNTCKEIKHERLTHTRRTPSTGPSAGCGSKTGRVWRCRNGHHWSVTQSIGCSSTGHCQRTVHPGLMGSRAEAMARILFTRSAQSNLRPDGRWHVVQAGPLYTIDYLIAEDTISIWRLNNSIDTPMTTLVSQQEDNVNA